MASHAGWKYVIKTTKGYINEKGELVDDIKDAKIIYGLEFGFSTPLQSIRKLTNKDHKLQEEDVEYYTLEPSYDSRLWEIEHLLMEKGIDYRTSTNISANIFNSNQLYNYDNYLEYIKNLNDNIIKYYEDNNVSYKTICFNDSKIKIYESNLSKNSKNETNKKLYRSKEGDIWEYSINLKNPNVEKYFNLSKEEQDYFNNWQNNGIEDYIINKLKENNKVFNKFDDINIYDVKINHDKLNIYSNKQNKELIKFINEIIREFYSDKEMHITRMFGAYIIIQKINGELKAVKATPIPIKHCPLMIKLLKEVGGDYAIELIESLKTENKEKQSQNMCKLIDEVVIKGGYFDTNRPLNSCEANVLFGASETMSSALKNGLIDAAVIVSNNLGTIITTNESNTQGAVKRMTGLFYTSPSKEIVDTAIESDIIPVFPYTADIDQLKGVKEAIKRGYKKIAVSVAANDNYLHEELKKLENKDIKIYKFGLCSTGIDEKTATIMKDNSDVVWSCASKYVKELIEPNAIAQVGIKIPVHIMTKDGWEIIKNHLEELNSEIKEQEITLSKGEEKPIFLNSNSTIKVLPKKKILKCTDCPHPCV